MGKSWWRLGLRAARGSLALLENSVREGDVAATSRLGLCNSWWHQWAGDHHLGAQACAVVEERVVVANPRRIGRKPVVHLLLVLGRVPASWRDTEKLRWVELVVNLLAARVRDSVKQQPVDENVNTIGAELRPQRPVHVFPQARQRVRDVTKEAKVEYGELWIAGTALGTSMDIAPPWWRR